MSEDVLTALGGFGEGSLVAGYRLEALVGTGGMAVVYRARDVRLGRMVALKILVRGLGSDSDEEFRRRFTAESQRAAAVDDPHIIPVYEAGEANGVLFIAMRFVGGDLRRVLAQEGALPPARAAAFISPVASALDAAHRAGLVHRDVKPANILVDAREDRPDHVYLSDFGVSKGAVSMTTTGKFLGTPAYAAPEQFLGRADGRTDQYSLAVVTYQLLTGSLPFERDEDLAMMHAHLYEAPPTLDSRRPGLAGAAGQVLAKGLAKDPDQRYGSCREFADALREAFGLPPYRFLGSVPHPPRPPVNEQPVVILATRKGWLSRANPPVYGVAFSPDGRLLASGSNDKTVRLWDPASGEPRRTLTGHAGTVRAVAFSPDGRLLASGGDDRTVRLWDPVGGRTLTGHAGTVWGVAFSPDGQLLASASDDQTVRLWDPASGEHLRTLTGHAGTVWGVAFSPGRLLASCSGDQTVRLWDPASGEHLRTLTGHAGTVWGVAFSPVAPLLASGSDDKTVRLWDLATGEPLRTLTGHASFVPGVAFSPHGRQLASCSGDQTVRLWDPATGEHLRTLTGHASFVIGVAFGPDGRLASCSSDGTVRLWSLPRRPTAGARSVAAAGSRSHRGDVVTRCRPGTKKPTPDRHWRRRTPAVGSLADQAVRAAVTVAAPTAGCSRPGCRPRPWPAPPHARGHGARRKEALPS